MTGMPELMEARIDGERESEKSEQGYDKAACRRWESELVGAGLRLGHEALIGTRKAHETFFHETGAHRENESFTQVTICSRTNKRTSVSVIEVIALES